MNSTFYSPTYILIDKFDNANKNPLHFSFFLKKSIKSIFLSFPLISTFSLLYVSFLLIDFSLYYVMLVIRCKHLFMNINSIKKSSNDLIRKRRGISRLVSYEAFSLGVSYMSIPASFNIHSI